MQEFSEISENSKTPKYLQLVNLIIRDIKDETLKIGDRLPSINEISAEYYLSRDTVEKALNELRKRGIITSVKRRGYFISSTDFEHKTKIAFITNTITDYKRNIYEALTREMGEHALVDVYVYNYDIKKFEFIVLSHMSEYDYFLVIPFFKSEPHYQKAVSLLNDYPDHKLIILDNSLEGIQPVHSSVSQHFELDIREALISLNDHLAGYQKHYLLYPPESVHPRMVVKGFEVFCKMYDYAYEVVTELGTDDICRNCNYVILDDEHLVNTIEIIEQKRLELGREVGLISYNETPLKRVLAGGLTVISTDWQKMGQKTAEMILSQNLEHLRIPYMVYLRNSILNR